MLRNQALRLLSLIFLFSILLLQLNGQFRHVGRLYLLLLARLALGTRGPSFFIVFLIGIKKNESQIHRDPRAKGVDTFDLPPEPLFLSSGLKRMLRLMVSTCTTEEGAGGE